MTLLNVDTQAAGSVERGEGHAVRVTSAGEVCALWPAAGQPAMTGGTVPPADKED